MGYFQGHFEVFGLNFFRKTLLDFFLETLESYTMEEVSDEFCQTQDENENNNGSNGIPVTQNLQEFLKCPFRWPESVSDVEFDEILL